MSLLKASCFVRTWRSVVIRTASSNGPQANTDPSSTPEQKLMKKWGTDNVRIAQQLEEGTVKPFNTIPGPRSFSFLGTKPLFWKIVGKYDKDQHMDTYYKFYKEFGEIVREDVHPKHPLVHIYNPADMQTMFIYEGTYPMRYSHMVLEKYRLEKPEVYASGGILPSNGPAWYALRKKFQKSLQDYREVEKYVGRVEEITDEFLEARIQPGIIEDCSQEVARLFMELTSLVAFDERFHAFSEAEMRPDSRSSRLMGSASVINCSIMKTNLNHILWRLFPQLSKAWRDLVVAHAYVEEVALEQIAKKMAYIKEIDATRPENRAPTSTLESYLRLKDTDIRDITGMIVDLLLGGSDTITSSMSYLLHNLSRHPAVQEKIYDECLRIQPDDNGRLPQDVAQKATYTSQVIRESLRINPVAIGIGRVLPVDVVMSGYHVPKFTHIVSQNQVACRLPQYFDDPLEFRPERWERRRYIRGEDHLQEERLVSEKCLSIPFSHGSRVCIAKKVAELDMIVLLLKLCRRYTMRWAGAPKVGMRTVLVHQPDTPIRIEFTERKSLADSSTPSPRT
uniref:Cytochrome P450 CYP302A1 n=1 Tax=Nilaparvata lugens TaxID=108931 RepID=A0A0K0LB82_NILLU|nr:cytochrome P450 CYP302A1 [Nilaparvata lugens]AIW79958.1 cytochrome P450 CYP302A1 [Nilaparvata lugens]